MRLNIGEMTFGDILSRAINLLFANILTFLAIQIIVLAPGLILTLALPEMALGFGAILFALPSLVLGPIGSAAMLRVITESFQGRSVGLGGAFAFALGRFVPLFITNLMAGIVILFALFLCCVPGIYLAVIWALVSQVVVVENLMGTSATSRSAELVSGHFWRVFGIIIVLGLIMFGLNFAIGSVLGIALPFQEQPALAPGAFPFPPPAPRLTSYVNFVIVQTVPLFVNVIGQTFIAICMTLVYFDLRYRKEQFNVYEEDLGFGGGKPSWRDDSDEPSRGDRPRGDGDTGFKSDDRDTGYKS